MEDSVREAIRYIGTELKNDPELDRAKLIEEASQRFDLNPIQSEFVLNRFRNSGDSDIQL